MSEVLHKNNIFFHSDAVEKLAAIVRNRIQEGAQIFVLTDKNTTVKCIPVLNELIPELMNNVSLEVPSGESYKNIDSCIALWKEMLEAGADRNSLIINVGGGMVCDLGGYVAANFKRGIDFINIPTTLLAQVDAAIGSKVGINLLDAKNQIGLFADPLAVCVLPKFLETLDARQLKSGFAEVIKHAILSGEPSFDHLSATDFSDNINEQLIMDAALFKMSIALKDKHEKNMRKILNYGHTFGHALESVFMNSNQELLHGEAVAYGIILETLASVQICGLPDQKGDKIITFLRTIYDFQPVHESKFNALWNMTKKDKKSSSNKVLMIGIKDFGHPELDVELQEQQFVQLFVRFNEIVKS